MRRSVRGAATVAVVTAAAGRALGVSGDPQSPQKRWSGGLAAPHDGHDVASDVPH
jgi:hypothetical protein